MLPNSFVESDRPEAAQSIVNLGRPAAHVNARPHMKFLVTVLLATVLGGCALIEPTAASHFNAKPDTPAEAVFTCAESTIRSLKVKQGTWSDVVTTRDIGSGLFETNQFNKVNIVGIRVQVRYDSRTGNGRIKVKASGAYFADLGADQAAEQLTNGIVQCL